MASTRKNGGEMRQESANARDVRAVASASGARGGSSTTTANRGRSNDAVSASGVRGGSSTASANKVRNGDEVQKKKSDYEAQVEKYVQETLKKRERNRKILILLCSLVAIGCLVYVGRYTYEDYRTKKNYEEMAEMKNTAPIGTIEGGQEGSPSITYTDTDKEVPEVLDEYKNLFNMNKKLIGWLKIDDTIIDYPVMQTYDNEYYLNHNVNQEKDRNGALFLDKDCDVLKPSTNLIIYGHHMKSGRMFGNLDDYASESYYKKHSIIQFDTIYEKGTYEVMYVFRSQVYSEAEVVFKYYQFIDCYSEQEFDSYMAEMADMSLYDTGVTAEYGDRLLTLSTCDNSVEDGRFVVVAKRIEE